MPGKWSLARRRKHSEHIRKLRALGAAGPYARQPQRLSQAHAEGRHNGGNRVAMSDEQRRESARLATLRYRARRDGKPITRAMYPQRSSIAFDVVAAGERLDAMLAADRATPTDDSTRGFQGAARIQVNREIHPLECLWRDHDAIDTTTAPDVDDALRLHGRYRPTGAASADWSSIHAHRRNAELAALAREQVADAAQ
jgi:hypothetical protein